MRITIRRFKEEDWDAVWEIIIPVFHAGETYAMPTTITEQEAYLYWVIEPAATYVAVDEEGVVLGTYYLRPNQQGPGDHICNCGYIVAESARGQGAATNMCRHSQQEAVEKGFAGMQYNLVASTNQGAVRVWQREGFEIVGTIPRAFRHPRHGLVDAYVMYKDLAVD